MKDFVSVALTEPGEFGCTECIESVGGINSEFVVVDAVKMPLGAWRSDDLDAVLLSCSKIFLCILRLEDGGWSSNPLDVQIDST